VFDAIAEQHPVRQAGERVVKGVVNELDLVRAKRGDRMAHLAGETKILDEGENQASEHGGDDAQPGDHVEQVEVTGLGALEGGREDSDGYKEVGERDLPRRRPLDLVARCRIRVERPNGARAMSMRPATRPASTSTSYRNDVR